MPTHGGNPFVNAGAIATVSLKSPAIRRTRSGTRFSSFYSKAAGEELVLIDEVYKSEAATNTGNKALSDGTDGKYDRIYADPFPVGGC